MRCKEVLEKVIPVIKKNITLIIIIPFLSAQAQKIELETKSILDDQVEIKIPKDFEIKYKKFEKSEFGPERTPLILTDKSEELTIQFSFTQIALSQKSIKENKDGLESSLKYSFPLAEWKNSRVKKINGRKIGYFEFIFPKNDKKIYSLMFFTDVKGELLLCTLNFNAIYMDEWTETAHEIMNSFKIK